MLIPEKLLLRRSEVRECLGISRHELRRVIKAKKLNPLYLKPGTRAYFRQADVLKLANKEQ